MKIAMVLLSCIVESVLRCETLLYGFETIQVSIQLYKAVSESVPADARIYKVFYDVAPDLMTY